jgi:hypothetical protein
VAKANRSIGPGGLQAQELLGRFGVKSASQRSQPMLAAIGVDPHRPGELGLESPRYLTAARRRQLIADRDRLSGAIEDDDLDPLAEHAARRPLDDLD